MQALQYGLQCPGAKDTSITHAAAALSNLDAAITMRYRDRLVKRNRNTLRDCTSKTTTIMQPSQCDPKPQIQETNRTTHTWTTTRCRTPRENRFDDETTAATPAARGTFHRRPKPLYTEKRTKQHSCSHYNAFSSITWQNCMYLRAWQHKMSTIMQPSQCDLQPQIHETHRTTHTWTTTRCRTPRENRFDDETTTAAPAARGTFHRRPKPLYTEKRTVSCSGFLPNTSPMQHSCSHYNAFRSTTLNECIVRYVM